MCVCVIISGGREQAEVDGVCVRPSAGQARQQQQQHVQWICCVASTPERALRASCQPQQQPWRQHQHWRQPVVWECVVKQQVAEVRVKEAESV